MVNNPEWLFGSTCFISIAAEALPETHLNIKMCGSIALIKQIDQSGKIYINLEKSEFGIKHSQKNSLLNLLDMFFQSGCSRIRLGTIYQNADIQYVKWLMHKYFNLQI